MQHPAHGGDRGPYESTKPGPGGNAALLVTPQELLDRVAALVPPPRIHRHRYFACLPPTHLCARPSPPSHHRPNHNQPGAIELPIRYLENFGSYKGRNRVVYFDIGDFDESVLAPCTWDLIRLTTSILVAAGVHDPKPHYAVRFCEALLDAYPLALRDGKARWLGRSTAQGLVSSVLQGLEHRRRLDLIRKRTELRNGKLKLRIDGKHTLPIDDNDRKTVTRAVREFADGQPNPKFFRVLDVARRIAGTGSLRLERYTVLIQGRATPA